VAETPFDRKLTLLMKEWDQCEASIGRFDTMSLTVRGWAVSVFTAVLAAAITIRQPNLVLFSIVPTLLFFVVDALNKSFQGRYVLRVRAIQRYLNSLDFQNDLQANELLHFETPTMALEFQRASSATFSRKLLSILHCFGHANVYTVYVSIAFFSLVSWLILTIGEVDGSGVNVWSSSLPSPHRTSAGTNNTRLHK
jgi:hypothetical protein